jgi:hypothetical protein
MGSYMSEIARRRARKFEDAVNRIEYTMAEGSTADKLAVLRDHVRMAFMPRGLFTPTSYLKRADAVLGTVVLDETQPAEVRVAALNGLQRVELARSIVSEGVVRDQQVVDAARVIVRRSDDQFWSLVSHIYA